MEFIENQIYEIRIFLIGDAYVGKKAIASRLKILNSTKTAKDDYFVSPKEVHSINDKREAEYNSKTAQEKLLIKREIDRRELMTFTKEINISNVTITINNFIIHEADQLPTNYEPKEEDEDYEFELSQHMSLRNVKAEIKKFLLKDPKSSFSNVINLFLFCYDLSDYLSFERIEVYYDQLDKFFKFETNEYAAALIGNKVDIKTHFNTNQRNAIKTFYEKRNMKYYEISTLMFFNFEKFFETIFFDMLSEYSDEFQKKTFKDRFHLIVSIRPNLSKAPRITFNPNRTPGPDCYQNNVYQYYFDKPNFDKTFDSQHKYTEKIFINKQGPVFSQKDHKNDKKGLGGKLAKTKNQKQEMTLVNWDLKNKKELQDACDVRVPGYSLGIRKGARNFKNERKEKFKEQTQDLNNALLQNTLNLHIKQEPKIKDHIDFAKYDTNKKENYQRIANEIKRMEDEGKEKRRLKLLEQEKEREKQIQKIEEKSNHYQDKYSQKEQNQMNMKNNARRAASAAGPRIERPVTPGPNAYDIRGKIDTKKGFTFGTKTLINPNKNMIDPGFVLFDTDFDLIIKKPKYADKQGNQQARFPQPKIFIPEEPKKILKKWEDWDNNKNSCLNAKKQQIFFESRKNLLSRAQERREEIEINRQEEIEEKIKKRAKINDEELYYHDINYKQVEEKTPLYSMKGKYRHGGIFDGPNYDAIDEEYDQNINIDPYDGANTDETEGKVRELRYPQYSVGKPSLVGFTFDQAKRFQQAKVYEPNMNIEEKMLFENGIFKPLDQTFYSTQQAYMGKHKKGTELIPSKIPGPGLYKIPGFADLIVKEGAKVNRVRTAIRNEERRKRQLLLENGAPFGENQKIDNKTNVDLEKAEDIELIPQDDDNSAKVEVTN